MKKLMILAVVAVFFGVSQLQTTNAYSLKNDRELIQEIVYKEINAKELPDVIKETLKDGYSDYTVDKAYLGSDESYKIEMSKSQEKLELFLNKEGKILKVKRPETSK